MKPILRFFLPLALASLSLAPHRATAQPATVMADPTTGALFRPAASTFISGNSLLTTTGAAAAYQPLDSDLTAIAALTTTANGRSLLTSTTLTLAGLGITNGTTLDTIGAKTQNGTGNLVLATSPTLTTPNIGAATATSITGPTANNLTLSGGSSGASLVLGSGASASATLTVTGQTGQFLAYQDSTLTARAQYGPVGTSSTGTGNTAFGVAAGTSQTLGTDAYNNSFFGSNAGRATTTGYQNTFVGSSSGNTNTTGHTNTGIGQGALYSTATDHDNAALGFHAALNPAGGGGQNTAVGSGALQGAGGSSAAYNTAVGYQSMLSATTASENLALGRISAYSITTGAYNVAVGMQSLYSNQTGSSNVALGRYAGAYETGSNAFYVDNQNRTNTAGDKAGALLYGVFAASADSQSLTANAGSVNFSAPSGITHNYNRTTATAIAGNTLGGFNGYNGATRAALFAFEGDGATDSGRLSWWTRPTGGSLTERLRLTSGGSFQLGLPSSAAALSTNSTLTFELTSNTSLTIKVRGTDGTTRSVVLTLAP